MFWLCLTVPERSQRQSISSTISHFPHPRRDKITDRAKGSIHVQLAKVIRLDDRLLCLGVRVLALRLAGQERAFEVSRQQQG